MTTLNINFNKIILTILIIVFFVGVTVLHFFEGTKRRPDSANASDFYQKVTELSGMSSLFTFGGTHRTGLGTKNSFFKILLLLDEDVIDQAKSNEDFDYLANTDDQFEYEEREISEGELLSIGEVDKVEKSNIKKTSDLEQDEKNKRSLIFKNKLTAVLNDSQLEFEERLENYKRDVPTDENNFVAIVDNDDIAESDWYYYAEEDIPLIEEEVTVP